MKKTLLAFLVVCILTVAIIPLGAIEANAATSGVSGDCTWKIENRVLTISGNGSMGYGITNPWGSSYFDEVIIEEGVTDIGVRAFSGCYTLTKVTLPSSLKVIYPLAFEDCKNLERIDIPEGVTAIDLAAFFKCISLVEINIPKTVTIIGDDVFGGCYDLQNIIVAKDNPSYVTVDGVLYNKDMTHLMKYPAKKTGGSYKVPDSVTEIFSGAFAHATYLETVDLPHNITKIGRDIFSNTNISKNNTVNGEFYMGEYLLSVKDVAGTITEYSVREGTRVIADSALYELFNMKTIIIPEGVITIGRGAFSTGYENITLPKSLSFIGMSAFLYGDTIKNVYYAGTRDDKAKITVEDDNESLTKLIWNYEACIGTAEHKWNKTVTKEAKCGVLGIQELNCTVCGMKKNDNIPALTHTYSTPVQTKAPTCSEKGVTTSMCTLCGNVETKDIAAKGHSFGDFVVEKEATYEETGTRVSKCGDCQEKRTEIIPKLTKGPETEKQTEKQTDPVTEKTQAADKQTEKAPETKELPESEQPTKEITGCSVDDKENDRNNVIWYILTGLAVVLLAATTTVIIIKKRK